MNRIKADMGFSKSWLWLIVLLGLTSCEKKIDFKLKSEPAALVVEAFIENGEAPRVILTNSFDYFSTINPQLLASAFVHDAGIYISNGSKTQKLKEYKVPVAFDYSVYYYSTDSSDLSTAFTGETGGAYSLKIESNGREYTAQTTIPKITKVIDSVWWKPAPPSKDSSRVIVMVRATDPPGYGDYVRYYTKKNDEPFSRD